jgi:hypothetical protein
MILEMRNPGLAPRVSRDLLCVGWSHNSLTPSEWQAQTLACRYCLSPWLAQDLAKLCFGESRDV